jgi:hypothetical protein
MNIERAFLISFLGNYLINTVVDAFVALIPMAATPGMLTPQFASHVVFSAVVVALLTWWYSRDIGGSWKRGLFFGIIGVTVVVVTAFFAGLAGVLTQTSSLSRTFAVIPNFMPFLVNPVTAVLIGIWLIPSTLTGYLVGRSSGSTV